MEVNSKKKKRKGGWGAESTGRKRVEESSDCSEADLPSLECVSVLQVFIRYKYVGEKKKKWDGSAV